MLPGPLRIDESSKKKHVKFDFSATRRAFGKRVLESVDSLVDVVQTTIFTVLTQKFQKNFWIYIVPFSQKSRKFGSWYQNCSNHFRTKLNRFYLL